MKCFSCLTLQISFVASFTMNEWNDLWYDLTLILITTKEIVKYCVENVKRRHRKVLRSMFLNCLSGYREGVCLGCFSNFRFTSKKWLFRGVFEVFHHFISLPRYTQKSKEFVSLFRFYYGKYHHVKRLWQSYFIIQRTFSTCWILVLLIISDE